MQRSAWVVRGAAATSVSAAWCHSTEDESVVLPQRWRHSHPTNGERPHLLFGVPKKGRMHERVVGLLQGAGIEYRRAERVDIARCKNLPLSLVFLPAADIAKYVGEGEVDIGITGEDILAESDVEVDVLLKLGIGKCRLSVQAPVGKFKSSEELAGKRIATSFPRLAGRHFAALESGSKEPTKIKVISGSVEAACGLGLADAVVDLVETGTTMKAAGLEEVAVVMHTQTVLIANPHAVSAELVETVRKRIAGYLTATTWVMCTYNVHRENLERCKTITPGKKSPSISPLERGDWVAVSALVPKKHAPAVMDELEAAGATDILLTGLVGSRMGD
ncbi:hypothetical protein CTAYLR_004652 [Chrysophaeum taylorii]|uniref:ATP phosphoribosyltransferase n=1 Tax=Chrysophaeum taylorii TaxID=2483200 RepID=A0AAD7XKK4_9STRA|nr:hypothetical protein CTAYLR_004652 [Chrysophaeum taylorii]